MAGISSFNLNDLDKLRQKFMS